MATWLELSKDSMQAAKTLADAGHWRSSISRAYYAAYCAMTERFIERGVRFPRGRRNPAHEQLLPLIRHNLKLDRAKRQRLSNYVRYLRAARENADYRPNADIDRQLALNCLRHARVIMKECGANPNEKVD